MTRQSMGGAWARSKIGRKFAMITSVHRAMDLMRQPGAHLIQVNGRGQPQWFIAPNLGRVDPKVAAEIKAHPQVRGDEDGMWPGLSQVWRMR
jgi:hypothetical protein